MRRRSSTGRTELASPHTNAAASKVTLGPTENVLPHGAGVVAGAEHEDPMRREEREFRCENVPAAVLPHRWPLLADETRRHVAASLPKV